MRLDIGAFEVENKEDGSSGWVPYIRMTLMTYKGPQEFIYECDTVISSEEEAKRFSEVVIEQFFSRPPDHTVKLCDDSGDEELLN